MYVVERTRRLLDTNVHAVETAISIARERAAPRIGSCCSGEGLSFDFFLGTGSLSWSPSPAGSSAVTRLGTF